jgi:hypothetical protein
VSQLWGAVDPASWRHASATLCAFWRRLLLRGDGPSGCSQAIACQNGPNLEGRERACATHRARVHALSETALATSSRQSPRRRARHRLPSGRIADVALLGESAPVAVLEVSISHLAPQEKSGHVDVPWIQLNGDEVIGDPLTWKPGLDRFKPYTCRKCKVQRVHRERALERIARQLGVQLPWGNYRVQPARCYRCRREILVFTWPGHTMWTVKRPPEPIPPTVKFTYTRTTGTRYWANTCPHCQAVQGDWNLYAEPGGAFFEVGQYENAGENTED